MAEKKNEVNHFINQPYDQSMRPQITRVVSLVWLIVVLNFVDLYHYDIRQFPMSV